MTILPQHKIRETATRSPIAPLLIAVLLTTCVGASQAAQLIPSIGFTKATDTNAADGAFSGGLALRVPLLPFLSAEGGISYRDESFSNNDLKVRMWPATASLWFTPIPLLYGGGGLGWYRTTYDYRDALPFDDVTSMQIGTHLGGGLQVPVAPSMSLDLHGRYIFMQKDNKVTFPTEFNPNFWNTSLGLAIKF
jgi:outer membrane protein with beta-barrel domain